MKKANTNVARNLIVMVVCWLITVGMGYYITFMEQPKEIELLERSEKVARMKQAEVATLLAESAASKEQADAVVQKWRARYKVLPATLSSPEAVGFLSDLTKAGFKNFDISLGGIQHAPDFSYYVFKVVGRGYFAHLYRFIWQIENSRRFFRINNLTLNHIDLITTDAETERERMQVMVSFSMELYAYFGGAEGLSAPQVQLASGDEPAVLGNTLPPVPGHVLPQKQPAVNPFFPIVMEELPPNTHGLIDVEETQLVAIVGDKAVFFGEDGHRSIGLGGDVYLGQITKIDAEMGRVVARLNKGGIIDEIEMDLLSGEQYRQALGPIRLAPTIP